MENKDFGKKDGAGFAIEPGMELVITSDNVMAVIDGLCAISDITPSIMERIPEDDAKKLMAAIIATFGSAVKMLPRRDAKKIFEELDRVVGHNISNYL